MVTKHNIANGKNTESEWWKRLFCAFMMFLFLCFDSENNERKEQKNQCFRYTIYDALILLEGKILWKNKVKVFYGEKQKTKK